MNQTHGDALQWLMSWYQDRCDGLWEHGYGITIGTLDNPGWVVKIDLAETPLESLDMIFDPTPGRDDDDDWYGYQVKEKVFKGHGDPGKLELLILAFRDLWEKQASGTGNRPIE